MSHEPLWSVTSQIHSTVNMDTLKPGGNAMFYLTGEIMINHFLKLAYLLYHYIIKVVSLINQPFEYEKLCVTLNLISKT